MRVTVYGHTGVVGGVLYRWLDWQRDVEVLGASLDAQDEGADDADWAFVCVPTPTVDGEQDQGPLFDVIHRTHAPNVVIRSTVLPGTCDAIAETRPHLNLYHWPEFLSARTAEYDFAHPATQIIGCGDADLWRETWEALLPHGRTPNQYTTRAVAELVKYTHNCHGAMEVIFANLIFDAARRGGADYEAVRAIMPSLGYLSRQMLAAYWNVYRDGKRGYAGACFPKDVQAFEGWLHGKAELLEGMERANARLRGEG